MTQKTSTLHARIEREQNRHAWRNVFAGLGVNLVVWAMVLLVCGWLAK